VVLFVNNALLGVVHIVVVGNNLVNYKIG